MEWRGGPEHRTRASHRTPAYVSLRAIFSPVSLAFQRASLCAIWLCEWRESHVWGFRLATPFFRSFWELFGCCPRSGAHRLCRRVACAPGCVFSHQLMTNLSENGVSWAGERCGEGFGWRSLSLSRSLFSLCLPGYVCGNLAFGVVGASVKCICGGLLAGFQYLAKQRQFGCDVLELKKSMVNASADVNFYLLWFASYLGALELCGICVCEIYVSGCESEVHE